MAGIGCDLLDFNSQQYMVVVDYSFKIDSIDTIDKLRPERLWSL